MRAMKKITILFLLISFCGGSNAVIEETKAVEESSTTASTSTTTTLFSPKFPEDFYTADEIVVFTDEFDKQLYEKYFVEKFLDSSTANEYKFYEVAYGYDDCIEVFFEAFEEEADSAEEQNLLTEEYCTRTVVIETEKVFTYPLMRSEINNSCKEDFNSYMNSYNLNMVDIKEKLKIETLWNEMIFGKYNNQIKIDEDAIKLKIKNQKKILKEYNLSEILFQLNSGEKLLSKYNLILENIKNSGFENSANLFSISDSSKFGGEIGWINQNQLNDKLINEIENLKIDEFTKPIQTGGGYLVIKLNNKRKKEKKLNFESAFKQMVLEEKNRQLNQFSLIYFNKIKQNIFISEK